MQIKTEFDGELQNDSFTFRRRHGITKLWHLTMAGFYSALLFAGMKMSMGHERILSRDGKIPAIGGPFKYMTHINLWVQLLFFGFQMLADNCSLINGNMQKVSSFLFTTVAFPMSAVVVITFWPIYSIDRNLVFPEYYDIVYPWYMNHFWHTTVLLWVLVEICLFNHQFPNNLAAGVSMLTSSSLYICWVVYINVTTGHWVYSFLEHLSPLQVAIFFICTIFISFGLYLVGKLVSCLRWGVKPKLN